MPNPPDISGLGKMTVSAWGAASGSDETTFCGAGTKLVVVVVFAALGGGADITTAGGGAMTFFAALLLLLLLSSTTGAAHLCKKLPDLPLDRTT